MYKTYILKVLKQEHPGVNADARVMSPMDSFIDDSFEKLAGSAPATFRLCPGERAARPLGTLDPGNDISPGDAHFWPGGSHLPRTPMGTPLLGGPAPLPWTAQRCGDLWEDSTQRQDTASDDFATMWLGEPLRPPIALMTPE